MAFSFGRKRRVADADPQALIVVPPADSPQPAPEIIIPVPIPTDPGPALPDFGQEFAAERSLWADLRRLDRRLAKAVALAEAMHGSGVSDRFRGLYVSTDDVQDILSRAPGDPALFTGDIEPEAGDADEFAVRLDGLQRKHTLSDFDRDVLLIALAPEVDLRYERVYAFLQDDVTRRRPTVDLILSLLTADADEKLARRAGFSAESPLLAEGLILLSPDQNETNPPLLARNVLPGFPVTRLLLGGGGLDPQIEGFCRRVVPRETPRGGADLADDATVDRLSEMVSNLRASGQAARIYLEGPDSPRKEHGVESVARRHGAAVLSVDLAAMPTAIPEFVAAAGALFREADFLDAVLYVGALDELQTEAGGARYRRFLDALRHSSCTTFLAGALPWKPAPGDPLGVTSVPFGGPDYAARLQGWRSALMGAGLSAPEGTLEALSDRFKLDLPQIEDAVGFARGAAFWNHSGGDVEDGHAVSLTAEDLFRAARAQSGHALDALASRVPIGHGWDDIVLPDDPLTQLHEICTRVHERRRVLEEWGFDRKLPFGKSLSALFTGPSGSGKTTAAEIVAADLGLELYRVDLARVVSKYIGETEANLERIFNAAENSNAILFFDEAESLYGKRSEVHDAHDRYANIELAYLLQKMDSYDGVVIMATNLRQNMDDAFLRRLNYVVEFPFPDDPYRERIWRLLLASGAPLADDIDYRFLGRRFRFTGGNIKNAVLGAAYLAAAEPSSIGMPHLIRAVWREQQKIGRPFVASDYAEYASHIAAGQNTPAVPEAMPASTPGGGGAR